MREVKNISIGKVSLKAPDGSDLADGQMWAYASVFGNTDSYGDRVAKGAFTNTLEEWKASGNTIPFLYGHDMSDPDMNIGAVLKAEEDDKGLKILVQFDQDPKAQKAYRLVKAGRLTQLSFAFDTLKSARLEDPEDPKAYRELQELKLYECSIVPIGANSATEVLAIKSLADGVVAEVKAGRTLSKANEETLRKAHESITAAADALATVLPDPEEDTPDGGEDSAKSTGQAVESGADTQSQSTDTPHVLDTTEIRGLDALLQEAATGAGESKTADMSSDPLVAEVALLGLNSSE